MDFFEVGKTKIPCKVSLNKRLKSRRLNVTPLGIELEVPSSQLSDNSEFLRKNEEWIFNQWYELGHREIRDPWPENFMSGAKVLFHDRYEMINITTVETNEVEIAHSIRGFNVNVPIDLPLKFRNEVIKDSFVSFFKQSLKAEYIKITSMYESRLSIKTPELKFIDRKDVWALCEDNGVIKLDWRMAFLPKYIIRYIVVHELCHLKERNHGKEFWNLISNFLPDYQSSVDYLAKKSNLLLE